MANIASTAAGVAIGHTVGHALTGALGIGGGHHEPAAPAEQQSGEIQQSPMQQQSTLQQQQQDPCRFELEQFLACAQNQGDLSLCDGFNQVLRECKTRYAGRM